MDPLSASMLTFGTLLLIISWVYLLIISFKEDFAWGMTTLFLPPVSYIYSLCALDKVKSVLVLAGIGIALIAFGL